MKIAGFYQEFWSPAFGAPTRSVTDYIAEAPYGDAQQIMAYLRSGYEMFSTMGMTRDVLGSGEQFVVGDSLSTGAVVATASQGGTLLITPGTGRTAVPAGTAASGGLLPGERDQ